MATISLKINIVKSNNIKTMQASLKYDDLSGLSWHCCIHYTVIVSLIKLKKVKQSQ